MTEELKFSPEEQAYLDAEMGTTPEPGEISVEEPVTEEPAPETPEPEPEKVEAETPEPEPDAEPEPEKEEPRPPRRTPQETIKGLRADRRELRDQVREQTAAQSKLQERLDLIAAKMEQPQNVPDPDMDPDAHREYQDQRIQSFEEKEEQQRQEMAKQAGLDSELAGLQNFVADQEDAYLEEHEDYGDAVAWGKEEYSKRLIDQYGLSKEDADAKVFDDIKSVAKQLQGMNGNVAHYLYQQAQAMGWGKAENGNGIAADNAEKVAVKSDDLKAIAGGQQAARNPKGGSNLHRSLQLEDYLAMDDGPFHKKVGDMNALKKLFGE